MINITTKSCLTVNVHRKLFSFKLFYRNTQKNALSVKVVGISNKMCSALAFWSPPVLKKVSFFILNASESAS